MKKLVRGKEYDTATATLIKKFTVGHFGDAEGYEESLYQTEGGLYFLYVNGGEKSPYKTENIKCIAKAKVAAWMETH